MYTSKLSKIKNIIIYDHIIMIRFVYLNNIVVLCCSYAHLTSTDASTTIVLLQRLPLGARELFIGVDGGHPKTHSICEIMARSSRPVTLDEWRGPKGIQTRTRTG